MHKGYIISGDRIQCQSCRRQIVVTYEWIGEVRNKCLSSKSLRSLVPATCPVNAVPIEILSRVRCKACQTLGAELFPSDSNQSSIDIYNLSQDDFSIIAERQFENLTRSQIITIYNQRDRLSMSFEHRKLLEEKYTKAYENITRKGGYAFVEHASTDGQD